MCTYNISSILECLIWSILLCTFPRFIIFYCDPPSLRIYITRTEFYCEEVNWLGVVTSTFVSTSGANVNSRPRSELWIGLLGDTLGEYVCPVSPFTQSASVISGE